MRKRIPLTGILAVCLLGVVTAFVLGNPSFQPQSNSTRESGPKKLTMWKFRSNMEDYVLYQWVKQWNLENPNLQVDLETIPFNDYLTQNLPTAFATGSAPDIYMISSGSFLKYAQAGFMLPLNQYINESLKEDLSPPSLARATYQQNIYGIPIEQEPMALFYNKKMFAARGLQPPAIWQDLIACAKALNSDQISGICLPNQRSDYQNFVFYSFLNQAVPGVKETNTLTQFSKSGAAALSLWRELFKYNYTQETNTESPSDIYPFASGQAAMQICGFWAVGTLEKYYPNVEYGVVPIPSADGKTFSSYYGGWYQAVNAESPLSKEAAEFTIWMWGQDASRPFEWCTEASRKIPARLSVVEQNKDFFNTGVNRIFSQDILPLATPEPRYPADISNAVSDAIFAAAYTDADIGALSQATQQKFRTFISQNEELFDN